MSEGLRVVLGPVWGRGFVEALEAVPGVSEVLERPMEGVLDALGSADVLVTFRWDDSWLVPGLRWIQASSAGVDQFPIERIGAAGIVLTSAVGIHRVQVSEHAFGLLLALTRGIGPSVRQQVAREWRWPRVVDLAGMTLGVIGLGAIGEAVALKAQAFGMSVIGVKRNPRAYAGSVDEVLGPDGLVEAFRRSDAVVVTLPGSDETEGLIGSDEFDALDGGFFVNVGRGSVVDEAALIAALDSGSVVGAGLDVFAAEPLPNDSPLWDSPGVVITPHLAGASPNYATRLAALFAENVAAFRNEGEWVNRVV